MNTIDTGLTGRFSKITVPANIADSEYGTIANEMLEQIKQDLQTAEGKRGFRIVQRAKSKLGRASSDLEMAQIEAGRGNAEVSRRYLDSITDTLEW